MNNVKQCIDEIIRLKKAKQFEKALFLANQYFNLYPDNDVIKFELAKLLIKYVNTYSLGESYLRELLSSKYISKNNVSLELSRVLIKSGKTKDGIKLLEKTIADNQNDIFLILNIIELSRMKIKLQKYEEAEKLLNKIISKKYGRSIQKCFNETLLSLKLRQEKYDEAYSLLQSMIEEKIISMDYIIEVELYLKNKLGILTRNQSSITYLMRQIYNYKWNRTLKHSQSHFKNIDIANFDYQFLDQIEIDKMIPSSFAPLCDKYYIELNRDIDEIETEVYGILTIANTSKIVSIFPEVPTYLRNVAKKIETKEVETKTKRKTQVEKFNLKYGNLDK